jgi:predicted glutamine amidotransferase
MCELLGMSANVGTDIVFSFSGLMQRGGACGPHRDGWGIGFYEGRGLRLFHDPNPSSDSEVARLIQRYPIKSKVVLAHIRHANVGPVCLANTHPFVRELGGRNWCFAHNGQLANFQPAAGFYQPIGSTDSEAAFCDLLNTLRQQLADPNDMKQLLPLLVQQCRHYAQLGVFNMLLSNGDWLFSFCSSKLYHITRRAPFGAAQLKDLELCVDFQQQTTPNDIVTVIATEPLTCNEDWVCHQSGQWHLWQDGICLASSICND